MFEAKNVIVCTGSLPKTMNLPKATIPLPIAIQKATLEQQISKSDKVVVFGTAHSGTLVLQNLYHIGCTGVVAIYRGKAPFQYARDGVPGGIKEESARIADAIVGNQWGKGTPKLLQGEDFAKVYRAVEKADSVIYAIGFEKTKLEYKDLSGATRQLDHDWETGRFRNLPNIWGFGIAFPSHLPKNPSYPDIGFDGFITAIHAALPSILQSTS
jgi:threonine dehydrogenase-like Zn-dependent dehydrogenase